MLKPSIRNQRAVRPMLKPKGRILWTPAIVPKCPEHKAELTKPWDRNVSAVPKCLSSKCLESVLRTSADCLVAEWKFVFMLVKLSWVRSAYQLVAGDIGRLSRLSVAPITTTRPTHLHSATDQVEIWHYCAYT